MNHISNSKKKTTVKILITALSLTHSSLALADQADVDYRMKMDAQNATAAGYQRCESLKKDVRDAFNKISESCRKAGLGSPNKCGENAASCAEASGSDTFSSTAQILSQMSTNTNIQTLGSALGQSGVNQSCPQMSGRDYWTEKDKITKDIETTQKELADLNDDKAKAEDEFNKQIQDLQDELNKAQEDLDKQKLDMKEKKRKMLADFQNQQNQMKDEVRKQSTQVLNLRGQLIQSQQDQALKLIAMTDASGKRACMKAVNDAKKAYDAVASSGSSNYIAQAKARKQDLLNTYNDCMDAFQQQRNALNKSKKQEQDQINKAITDAQQSMDEINNSLSTAQSQLTEMQNDAQTEEDNATQKVVKLMQTNQNKMLAAQQKMQSNLQTIATKNQNLTQKLNRLNNSLMTLGAAPKSRSSDYSPSDASSDIGGQVENINDMIDSAQNSPDEALRKCFDAKVAKEIKSRANSYKGVE